MNFPEAKTFFHTVNIQGRASSLKVWRDAGLKTAMLIRTFESLAIRKKSILDFFLGA